MNAIEQLILDHPASALYFATVQQMAKHFNKHTAAAEQILANQLANGEPAKVIQRAVATRFNSWIGPFKSVQSCKQAIRDYSFANPTAPFSDVILHHPIDFWNFVDQCIALLEPFDIAIKVLAAEDATLDLMLARYILLVNDLEKAKVSYDSPESPFSPSIRLILVSLTNLLIEHLELKFTPFTDAELIAFVLNPFHCERDGKTLWNSMVEEGIRRLKAAWQREGVQVERVNPRTLGASSYGADFALPSVPVPDDELDSYLAVLPTTEKAVDWWKANHESYPGLSRFAKRYLVAYPAQAESEREFSKLRNTITYLRNRLGHEKVFQLSVIRSKLKELYSPPSAARSEANIAADARRVQTTAATRLKNLRTAYQAIPANPAAPPPLPPTADATAAIIQEVVEVIGDGAIDGDDDYEPGDAEEAEDELFRLVSGAVEGEAHNRMDIDDEPASNTRGSSRGKPKCTLLPVYDEIHQYIATFENLSRQCPPHYKNIFGHRSVHIERIIEISIVPTYRWHIIVTSKAKRKFPGVRNLMRELGEIIEIEDSMYPPV